MRTLVSALCLLFVTLSPLCGQYLFLFDQPEDYPSGWIGDTADFRLQEGQLRLEASTSGTSQIYYPYSIEDSARWVLEYRMDFAPSNQNYLEIDLFRSDTSARPHTRYTLHIGQNGSRDSIFLTKYLDEKKIGQVASLDSAIAYNSRSGTLSIQYHQNRWEGWFLSGESPNPVFLFALPDTFVIRQGWFGLRCVYSKTRRDKFYFDRLEIGDQPVDTIPPRVVSVHSWDAHTLELEMSEPIDTSGMNNSSIQMRPSLQYGTISYRDKHIWIEMVDSVAAGTPFVLHLRLFDLSGNPTGQDAVNFKWIYTRPVAPYDVIFNEIMSDPNPQVGLPDAEYIELYNRSNKYIDLSELYLSDEARTRPLPDDTLPPYTYLILTRPKDSLALASFGRTIGVPGFPGLQNEGEQLTLTDYLTAIIDQVDYTPSGKEGHSKQEGGWSLELRHPRLVCSGAIAWYWSENLLGGTPGKANSQSAEPPVLTGPKLDYITVKDRYELGLHFNQKLCPLSVLEPSDVLIPEAPSIADIRLNAYDPFELRLHFSAPIDTGHLYRLHIKGGIESCIKTRQEVVQSAPFALAVPPAPGDMLINEILFNPYPGEQDFIELINASDKVVDLREILIGNVSEEDTLLIHPKLEYPLLPGQMIALTSFPSRLKTVYHPPDSAWIISAPLPKWNDDHGNATLYRAHFGRLTVLDQMNYETSMHSVALRNDEGVSLERISLKASAKDVYNWQSGVPSTHYATPGYKNAGAWQPGNTGKTGEVSLSKDSFTPELEGVEGLLKILYSLEGSAGLLSCTVFDMEGRVVKNISRAQPIGHRGFVSWDGTDLENNPCVTGVYIILAALYEPQSGVYSQKLPVLLKQLDGQ